MKKLYISIFSLILWSTVWAAFEVAPPIHIINLDRPFTKQVHLKNISDRLVKIKIFSERPENQKDESLYMGEWIVVYPKLLYLKPGEKKVVRFAARAPKGLKDGEYRSLLVFEQMQNKTYSTEEGESQEKATVGLEILQTVVSSVYGNKGSVLHEGRIEGLKIQTEEESKFLTGNIINTGTATIDPIIKLSYISGNKVVEETEEPYGKVIRENLKELMLKLGEIPEKADQLKVEIYEAGGDKVAEEIMEI